MECAVCYEDDVLGFHSTGCKHLFCEKCIKQLKGVCAICRRVWVNQEFEADVLQLVKGIRKQKLPYLEYLKTQSKNRAYVNLIIDAVLRFCSPRRDWNLGYLTAVAELCRTTSKHTIQMLDISFDYNTDNINFVYCSMTRSTVYSNDPVFDFILKDGLEKNPCAKNSSLKLSGVHLLQTKITLTSDVVVNAIQYAVGVWAYESGEEFDISKMFSRFDSNLVLAAALSLRDVVLLKSFNEYTKRSFRELCIEYGCPHYYIESDVEALYHVIKHSRKRKISAITESETERRMFVNDVADVVRALLSSKVFGGYIAEEDGWLVYRA